MLLEGVPGVGKTRLVRSSAILYTSFCTVILCSCITSSIADCVLGVNMTQITLDENAQAVVDGKAILEMRELAKTVPVIDGVMEYAVRQGVSSVLLYGIFGSQYEKGLRHFVYVVLHGAFGRRSRRRQDKTCALARQNAQPALFAYPVYARFNARSARLFYAPA